MAADHARGERGKEGRKEGRGETFNGEDGQQLRLGRPRPPKSSLIPFDTVVDVAVVAIVVGAASAREVGRVIIPRLRPRNNE